MSGDWKPGRGQAIRELYAWVATEPDGGEGVAAMYIASLGGMTPLIGADLARIRSLRSHAEAVQRATGYPMRLVRFSTRQDLETLAGDTPVNDDSPPG